MCIGGCTTPNLDVEKKVIVKLICMYIHNARTHAYYTTLRTQHMHTAYTYIKRTHMHYTHKACYVKTGQPHNGNIRKLACIYGWNLLRDHKYNYMIRLLVSASILVH